MRPDWRLVAGFGGLGAYFLARFFGASVLVSIAVGLVVGAVIYAVSRARRGGPRDPNAAP